MNSALQQLRVARWHFGKTYSLPYGLVVLQNPTDIINTPKPLNPKLILGAQTYNPGYCCATDHTTETGVPMICDREVIQQLGSVKKLRSLIEVTIIGIYSKQYGFPNCGNLN